MIISLLSFEPKSLGKKERTLQHIMSSHWGGGIAAPSILRLKRCHLIRTVDGTQKNGKAVVASNQTLECPLFLFPSSLSPVWLWQVAIKCNNGK